MPHSNISPKAWTPEEDAVLIASYFTHTRQEIAVILNRTIGSIRKRCSVLGLNHKHPAITDRERERIKEWYADREQYPLEDFNLGELAHELDRTRQTISREAQKMGISHPGRHVGERQKAQISDGNRRKIAKNGHPRGFKGHYHSDKVRKEQADRNRLWQGKLTPLEREVITAKRNATMLAKYGTGNPSMLGTNGYSRVRRGKRADLNDQFFRSAWEANYARYLNFLIEHGEIKAWEYEPETFIFHGVTRGVLSYTPDFKVINNDDTHEWHEVKGWMDAKSKAKLKRMAKYYPDEKVIVIDQDEYKALSKWKKLYDGWED